MEPRCALDIGQSFRVGPLEQIVPSTANDHEAHVPYELFIVILADSKERHDIAAQVVDDLHIRFRLSEEQLTSSEKRFCVASVFRNEWQNSSGSTVLATDVNERGNHKF